MKCPVCQAKLLPVDGELFCLQCGNAVALTPGTEKEAAAGAPVIEETSDPLLQRAIVDALHHQVQFRLPVAAAAPQPSVASFASMRAVLAPPRPALAGAGGGAITSLTTTITAPVSGTVPTQAKMGAPAVVQTAAQTAGLVTAQAVVSPMTVAATGAKAGSGAQVGPKAQAELGVSLKAVRLAPPAANPAAIGINNVAKKTTMRLRLGPMAVAWGWGIAAFVLFVGTNLAVYSYFAQRVYPGVSVGNLELGGVPFGEVRSKLMTLTPQSDLTVTVGSEKFTVTPSKVGAIDVDRLEREVREMGHSTPLPVAGVARSMLAAPLTYQYAVNDAAMKQVVSAMAQKVDRPAADAVPVILNGTAFVISEKPGSRLATDKMADLIRKSLGTQTSVSMEPTKIAPLVTAGAFRTDVDGVQARLGLNIQVKVRTAMHTVPASQLSGWLVVGSPGKGVAVDTARVASYINGLPGKFDRAAAVTAVVGAVQNNQSLTYTAVTSKNVVAPKPQSIALAWPLRSYQYCMSDESGGGSADALRARTAAVTGAGGPWALSGALAFGEAQTGCNFTIRLLKPEAMAGVSQACANQSTCQVGSVIAVNAANWAAAPKTWPGTLDSYRAEMIGHEVGHWLGFDHTSCTGAAVTSPLSQTTAVTVPGCSPNWFAVPVETQGVKVLPGF